MLVLVFNAKDDEAAVRAALGCVPRANEGTVLETYEMDPESERVYSVPLLTRGP